MKTQLLWIGLACFIGAQIPLLAIPLPPRYRIDARIDLDQHRISGSETLTLTNATNTPIQEITLFLYPNRFSTKNSALTEMNYLWHYPSGFDKGWTSVGTVRDTAGIELSSSLVEGSELPAGTLLRVQLPDALPAGSDLTLKFDFETRIPHKYGPFGHYRQIFTLQGGWHPYLVPIGKGGEPLVHAFPQRSQFELHLTLSKPRDAVLNGTYFNQVSEIETQLSGNRRLSLVIAPRLYPTEASAGRKTVTFYSPFANRYKLSKAVNAFVKGTVEASRFLPSGTPDHISVVETYLRAVMSFPADSMILVSDRFMVTVEKFNFRDLNRLEAARAVAQLMATELVAAREDLENLNWVSEAVAWAFRNQFLSDNFEHLSNLRDTAGSMSMFRPFNRMAASPTIPFSETYVGNVVNRDPLRESMGYFNNDLPSGQLLADKLRETVGEQIYLRAMKGYLGQHSSFQSFVSKSAGRDMGWFFEQWKQGYPANLDYAVTNVSLNRKTGKDFLSSFTIRKQGGAGLVSPVEVRVTEEKGSTTELLWDGVDSDRSFQLHTEHPVNGITIDPHSKTVQTNDYNDLAPHTWEMVMDRGDVDIGSGGLGAGMRIRLHRKRDRSKWMFVTPFFSPAELGVEAGMLFDFGGNVEGLVWNKKQELSLSYSFTNLRGGFADLQSGRLDGAGQNAGVKMRYSFQNKMFEEDPMSFTSLDMTAAVFRKELGGDFNFFRAGLSAAKAVPLHPGHKLAGVVSLAYSDGFRNHDEIPAQALADLSSFPFIGFAGSGRFLAENALATSLEWRHDLMTGLDMSMPMNNRIRRIQGVLAFDVGWVDPRFEHLFRLNQAIYGVRYGLRFHYDFLGIRPSNFTVDIGHRLGDGNRDGGSGLIFALGILQSF